MLSLAHVKTYRQSQHHTQQQRAKTTPRRKHAFVSARRGRQPSLLFARASIALLQSPKFQFHGKRFDSLTTNVLLRLAPTIKMREHEIEVQVRLKTLGNVADKLREYLEVETAPDDLLERGGPSPRS